VLFLQARFGLAGVSGIAVIIVGVAVLNLRQAR